MTIQQLYYVLEVARTGSVNRTAKELFVSQPCISVSIKKLEEELGFPIFVRSSSGVKLTAKGKKLVDEAGNIITSIERISSGEEDPAVVSSAVFRVVHMHYLPSYRAFVRLSREYEQSKFFQFSFYGLAESSAMQEDAAALVSRNACDCVAWFGADTEEFKERCRRLKVAFIGLGKTSLYLNLAKDHPILLGGIPDHAEVLFPRLKEYPYVSYNHLNSIPFPEERVLQNINPDKIIHFSSMALRTEVVANTTGFSISMRHKFPDEGVVSIPFCGEVSTVGLLYSEVRGLGSIGERYLELLRDEMEFLSTEV